MIWINQFDLFLFDFDGLLVNTEQLHFDAYIGMCRARGFILNWDFNRFCKAAHFESTGLRDAIYAEFPALYAQEPEWEVLYEEKKIAYLNCLKGGKLQLMPGVEPLLKALEQADIKRCVVTNSLKEQIDLIKACLPILQSIPHWITRECYDRSKPSPDAYLKAMELFKAPEDEVIGFEDTSKGLRALKAAGADVNVLICPSDHPQLETMPFQDFVHFTSFEEIPDNVLA
jgi:beta-phosphoglucomutase